MAALQRVASSVSTTASSYGLCTGADVVVADQFPAGLRVLVVDDDATCLKVLEQMLRRCLYQVTTCSQATAALNLLRERRGCFDVVLSDVHMPDMDGFKLLEDVGLEMDLPVIMMSADGRTSTVMRGVRHGACDYLIKPIREEELKNMWQHVVRKKWNENKELENSGSLDNSDRHKRANDEVDYTSSVNEGIGALKGQKKRSNSKEEIDDELENEDPSTSKKPRVVWSVELHQQFVSAVNQLGIDKAVPKRILELMNVPGLTRENVASHLQKFRLYLKRLSGVAQQGGISGAFCTPLDSNVKLNSLGRFDFQALATSGQIPPQTFASLHAELLGQPTGSLVAAMDQPGLLQASIQGPKCMPVEHGLSFDGQPLVKCQSSISKRFPQNMVSIVEARSGFGVWPSNNLGTVGPSSNHGGMNPQSGSILMEIPQQQQRQLQLQQSLSETNRSINVQPSCLVVPSQSSASIAAGTNSVLVNRNCSFNSNAAIDYNLLSPLSNNSSLNTGPMSDGDLKATGVLSGYSAPSAISPSMLSCSVNAENNTLQNSAMTFRASKQLPELAPNICNILPSCGANVGEVLDQGPLRNLGFVGKGTCIPSLYAVDEFDSPMSNLGVGKISVGNNVNKVKREPNMESMDNARVGIPILQQFPPADVMGFFTE